MSGSQKCLFREEMAMALRNIVYEKFGLVISPEEGREMLKMMDVEMHYRLSLLKARGVWDKADKQIS